MDIFALQGFALEQYAYEQKKVKHEEAFQGRTGSVFDYFEDENLHTNQNQCSRFQGLDRPAVCNLVTLLPWLYSHA